jgi:hypothetical protein
MKLIRIFLTMMFLLVLLTFNAHSFDYIAECDEVVGKGVFLNSSYIFVNYDKTHPDYDKLHSVGGWAMGLTFDKFDPDIRNVRISGGGATINKTIGFDFLVVGKERSAYNITLGNDLQVADVYHIRAWNKQGTPIRFIKGQNYLDYLTVHPKKDLEMVPVCEITDITFANNEITVFANVPYDPRAVLIRLNIFESDNNIIASYRFDNLSDKMQFIVPGEFENKEASLIYVLKDKNYILRGGTRLSLIEK